MNNLIKPSRKQIKPLYAETRIANCENCLYLVKIDFGYNNWTIEGTTYHCLFNKNSQFPVNIYHKKNTYENIYKNKSLCFVCKMFNHFADPKIPQNIAPNQRITIDADKILGNMIHYTSNKQLKALLELYSERIEQIINEHNTCSKDGFQYKDKN